MKVSTFKKLFSAVEAAEMIMNNWSNEEDNVANLVIWPTEKNMQWLVTPWLVVINIAQLHSTKFELIFEQVQILLALFRRIAIVRISDSGSGWSTIPQKQFIIIINDEIDPDSDKLGSFLPGDLTVLS